MEKAKTPERVRSLAETLDRQRAQLFGDVLKLLRTPTTDRFHKAIDHRRRPMFVRFFVDWWRVLVNIGKSQVHADTIGSAGVTPGLRDGMLHICLLEALRVNDAVLGSLRAGNIEEARKGIARLEETRQTITEALQS